MSKYLVFGFDAWDEKGGLLDLAGWADTHEEAWLLIQQLGGFGHIADAQTLEILAMWENHFDIAVYFDEDGNKHICEGWVYPNGRMYVIEERIYERVLPSREASSRRVISFATGLSYVPENHNYKHVATILAPNNWRDFPNLAWGKGTKAGK